MTPEKINKRFSINERLQSFKYACNGLRLVFKNEHNARIHLFATLLVVVAGRYLKIERWEWISIFIAIGLVFITELLNSALEQLADKVSPEQNKAIGAAKDLAAGAVLVAALIALIIGGLIFIPKFF